MIDSYINTGLVLIGGMCGYIVSLFATTVEVNGATLIPAGAVVAFAFVIWKASREWQRLVDKVDGMEEKFEDFMQFMKTRPCMLPGENCEVTETTKSKQSKSIK